MQNKSTACTYAGIEVSCDIGTVGSSKRLFRVELGSAIVAGTIEVQFRVAPYGMVVKGSEVV